MDLSFLKSGQALLNGFVYDEKEVFEFFFGVNNFYL